EGVALLLMAVIEIMSCCGLAGLKALRAGEGEVHRGNDGQGSLPQASPDKRKNDQGSPRLPSCWRGHPHGLGSGDSPQPSLPVHQRVMVILPTHAPEGSREASPAGTGCARARGSLPQCVPKGAVEPTSSPCVASSPRGSMPREGCPSP